MAKTAAVLGLGQYGKSYAKFMYEFGADVLVVDIDEERLKELSMHCTSAIRADLTIESEVSALGLDNMDIVVVAMAGNLAASIMSVAIAKEQNVPLIVAKSGSDRMSSILSRLGADQVIVPERIGAMQSAMTLSSGNLLEYFKVDDNLCMVEMNPLSKWVGKSTLELDLRSNYDINVVAIMSGNVWELLDPARPFSSDDTLLIALKRDNLHKLGKKHK